VKRDLDLRLFAADHTAYVQAMINAGLKLPAGTYLIGRPIVLAKVAVSRR
jgi:hypothetical protein